MRWLASCALLVVAAAAGWHWQGPIVTLLGVPPATAEVVRGPVSSVRAERAAEPLVGAQPVVLSPPQSASAVAAHAPGQLPANAAPARIRAANNWPVPLPPPEPPSLGAEPPPLAPEPPPLAPEPPPLAPESPARTPEPPPLAPEPPPLAPESPARTPDPAARYGL